MNQSSYTEKRKNGILFHRLRIVLCAAALVGGALTGMARQARKMNVRDVNTTIDPAKITVPASFEVDIDKMMQNWYIKNYTVLDRDVDNRPVVEASKEVIIERLQSLPNIIEMPYNEVVHSFIKMYVDRKRSHVEAMLGISLYYMPIFEQVLDLYDMPIELKYLPIIESALNPNAVSPVGATGLWQFMTKTAKGEGLEINSLVDERRDPYRASDAAARYLKKLYGMYNDWTLAIAAYNCGPGKVNKAIRRSGGKKDFWSIYFYLPSETRDYIPAFIAANYVMNYYHEHNISPALAKRPIITDTVHVSRRVHFQQISDVLDIPMEELRALNPQYREDIIPGNIKPYALILPNLQAYNYITNEDSIVNHDAEKYARQEVVDLSGNDKKDEKGEYEEELVIKYHKVKKGDSLSKIAKKYGVSTSAVRQANGGKKRLKRGTTLKIKTYQRRYIEPADTTKVSTSTDSLSVANDSIAKADSTVVTSDANSVVSNAISTSTENNAHQTEKKADSKPVKPKTTSYTVKSGDTLSKIASKFGVTVKDIQQANNLRGTNIIVGQKLKIPVKQATKKKKRRRR